MLLQKEKLEEQLSKECDAQVKAIYQLLAYAKTPSGMTVRPHGHGFISRELRYELDGRWYYSAVLNQSWVLWYFRRPALTNLQVEPEEILQLFPTAETTGQREVKLRVNDMLLTYAVLGWTLQQD